MLLCNTLNMATQEQPRKDRDDFDSKVIYRLYTRVGGLCSKCSKPTFGPKTPDPSKPLSPPESFCIGEAAHICAAAKGGPRYDPNMSTAERTSAANGLWLCCNCHREIDRDEFAYPKEELFAMKRKAEKKAKDEAGQNQEVLKMESSKFQLILDGQAIHKIWMAKDSQKLEGGKIHSRTALDLMEQVDFLLFDSYHIRVWDELISFYSLLASKQFHCPCDEQEEHLFFTVWRSLLRNLDIIFPEEHESHFSDLEITRLLENTFEILDEIKEHRKWCSVENQHSLLESVAVLYVKLSKLVPLKKQEEIQDKIKGLKGLLQLPVATRETAQNGSTTSNPLNMILESSRGVQQPNQPTQPAMDVEADDFFEFLSSSCMGNDLDEITREKWENKGYYFDVQ